MDPGAAGCSEGQATSRLCLEQENSLPISSPGLLVPLLAGTLDLPSGSLLAITPTGTWCCLLLSWHLYLALLLLYASAPGHRPGLFLGLESP
jgi:hypothetical protein